LITGYSFFTASAQSPNTSKQVNTQSQAWFSINSTMRLYKKWGMVADAHIKSNNFMADASFYFLRMGVNYWLKDNISFTLGYAKLWSAPTTPGWQHFAEENRIYQQALVVTKFGEINIVNRIRNEQRWQEKIVNDHFTGEYKFTDRIRYLFSTTTPFFKNPQYPSLVISDEILIQIGNEVVYNTFDQNRFFIGLKQPINQQLSFDIGYMQVFQQKASGYQYDKNQTFRLFFYYTPDFRKQP
jgi:hypothetical protein